MAGQRPNGVALQIANHRAVSVLATLKGGEDNMYPTLIKEFPEYGIQDTYIAKLEASGALKRTDSMEFDQWYDGSKPFENFKVTTAVTGASAGADIVVTLTADSHIPSTSGKDSPIAVGHLYVDDATGFEYVIKAVDKTVDGAHKATLSVVDITKTGAVTTASVLLWKGRAGTVEEKSNQLDGLYKGYGKRSRSLSVIRTDKAYTDFAQLEALKGSDGIGTFYDLDKTDLNRRHLFTTEYTLMQSGAKTNIANISGSRNSNAEGLIPQIQRYGEDLGAITINDAFYKTLARSANANGTATSFDILTDQEFIMANEDYLSSVMVAQNIQQVVNRDGLEDLRIAFGFSTFNRYGMTFNVKNYDLFNSARIHGSDNPNSYTKGLALFIPQGTVQAPDGESMNYLRVRYMTTDGWVNHMGSDGSFVGKGTENKAVFSLTAYKGLETFNIGAYKVGKLA